MLAERLRRLAHIVRIFREPGGTPIGEEIRHTLKHSQANAAMFPETELLLMNAKDADTTALSAAYTAAGASTNYRVEKGKVDIVEWLTR